MELWYLWILALLGIPTGYLLARIAPEELHAYKPNIILYARTTLFLFTLLTLYYGWNWIALLAFPLGYWISSKYHEPFFYLGIALAALFLTSLQGLLTLSILIYLYGISTGLLANPHQKWLTFTHHAVFLLAPLILVLFREYTSTSTPFLLSFAAGATFLRR